MTQFSMGLPCQKNRIICYFGGFKYSGFFVRHLENLGVVFNDDDRGEIVLSYNANWKRVKGEIK